MTHIATLSAIAIPNYITYRYKAQVAATIAEIRILEEKIASYAVDHDTLPESLNDIGAGPFIDPWGNPYQYLNIAADAGKARKDRFLVPINTDFDLCSMGRDGETHTNLTVKASHDDIIRANNGSYIGLGIDY